LKNRIAILLRRYARTLSREPVVVGENNPLRWRGNPTPSRTTNRKSGTKKKKSPGRNYRQPNSRRSAVRSLLVEALTKGS